MQESSQGTWPHWGPEEQDRVLRQASQTVLSHQAAIQLRQLLGQEGVGLVLLGQYLAARDAAKEKIAVIDLTDPKGVQVALRQQGQLAGIDLCISILFDIANTGAEDDSGERTEFAGNFAV